MKSVTLSGVLNVIAGAAACENRLLVMTTSHIEKLDDALIRPGLWDSRFEITYTMQIAPGQTFKRIFSLESSKIYNPNVFDHFAWASKAQFPEESTSWHCGRYRNRPVEAVLGFPVWLEIGEEIFTCSSRPSRTITSGEGSISKPMTFDRGLFNVTS